MTPEEIGLSKLISLWDRVLSLGNNTGLGKTLSVIPYIFTIMPEIGMHL